MVVALSYFLAVIITVALAIVLYPIAGILWLCGLLGKLSDDLFGFTKKTIKKLWQDIKDSERANSANAKPEASVGTWTCKCGCVNSGKFCSECGSNKPTED